MIRLGFKGCLEETKGCYPLPRIKNFFYELKLGWNRFYYGYDKIATWNIDYYVTGLLIQLLTEYRKSHIGLWSVDEDLQKYAKDGELFLTEETQHKIIDEIIWHLKMMDADYCEEYLYGNSYMTGTCSIEESVKRYPELSVHIKEHKDEAFDLLKSCWFHLWD